MSGSLCGDGVEADAQIQEAHGKRFLKAVQVAEHLEHQGRSPGQSEHSSWEGEVAPHGWGEHPG